MYRFRLQTQQGRLAYPALALVVLLAASAVGFQVGQGIPRDEPEPPDQELPGAEERLESLAQELEIARTRGEVDRVALELVRRELAGQKEQIAELEEGLNFYRSLMAPGDIAQGLSLRGVELVAGDNDLRFAYRIVAQQEARKHSLLQGELSAEVYGLLAGQEVSYPLAELTEDLDGNAQVMRFRYFQAFEGVLTLPEGFAPQGIRVAAQATAPRKIEISEDFRWQVKKRFTHVGK